jgi:hypothetical protein
MRPPTRPTTRTSTPSPNAAIETIVNNFAEIRIGVNNWPGTNPRLLASGAARPEDAGFAQGIGHNGIWVEPKLLAEIEYRAKSAEGKVRHPFFKGLRDDL